MRVGEAKTRAGPIESEPVSGPEMQHREHAEPGARTCLFQFRSINHPRAEKEAELEADAAWLKANQEARVRIQGAGDDLDIAEGLLGLISQGKEKSYARSRPKNV